MNIRITKKNVQYCTVCSDVQKAKEIWDKNQKALVESGEQETAKEFPGVPGYTMTDDDHNSYLTTEICEDCLRTIIRGIGIIHEQNINGVSLSNK